jgi:putative nucleotide binding protein
MILMSKRDLDYSKRRGKEPREKSQFIKKDRIIQILDVLLHGHFSDDIPMHKQKPIVQCISLEDFVLYEVEIIRNSAIKVQDKGIYGDFRNSGQLGKVEKKIDYDDLTPTSKALLNSVLEARIRELSEEFLYFFNNSVSITPRLHQLQLVPGIGKKLMWEIIEARNKKKFESFEDISQKTSISDPVNLIVKLIIKELSRNVKYYIFSKTQRYEQIRTDTRRQYSPRYEKRRSTYLRREKFQK